LALGGVRRCAGGAAAAIFPSAQMAKAASQISVGGYTIADLNPITVAYDTVETKIQIGTTPEDLGIHPPPPLNLTTPDIKAWQGEGSTPSLGPQNGWAQNAPSQTTPFNNRMEDMRYMARNPGGWRRATPPF
jgi:hypothetical protein